MDTAEITKTPCIIEHFRPITEPRILLKTRHKLIDIIAITLCGVIAGADDWTEIADFGKAKEEWFRKFLELPSGIPSMILLVEYLPEFVLKNLACFINWVRSTFENIAPQVIAIDGKTSGLL
jgi:hypothetical protein